MTKGMGRQENMSFVLGHLSSDWCGQLDFQGLLIHGQQAESLDMANS